MPRRTNIYIDDVAEASDTVSVTDGTSGLDHDISDLIDDRSEIDPPPSDFSAWASAEEAMFGRDEPNVPFSGMRRLSLLASRDRGMSPVRGRSRSRSRSRSPTPPISRPTSAFRRAAVATGKSLKTVS